jgi:hypothetical protein
MPKGILFWVVWVLALAFSTFWNWPGEVHAFWPNLVVFFGLTGLLGWKVFGAVVQ